MTLVCCEIRKDLPDGFDALLSDSVADGHQFLQRLQTEWVSRANRFSMPGELLLAAIEKDRFVGMGGINVDPYLTSEFGAQFKEYTRRVGRLFPRLRRRAA